MDAKIGSVTIESKIDTQGVEKGSKDIKKELDGVAEAAGKSVEKVNQEFDDIDTSQVEEKTKRTTKVMKEEFSDAADKIRDSFEELPEPCKDAFDKISQIIEDGTDDQKTKAAKIAGVFKNLGQDSSTAMRKAWEVVKAESEEATETVIDNLRDIQKEAEATGKEIGGIVGTGEDGLVAGLLGGITGSAGGIAGEVGAIAGAVSAGLEKAIDVLEEAAKAMIEFGKESINVASDLEEVQNVVDVVFTTMSEEVNAFSESMAEAAGLSETMAKKYVGTFGSMATSIGFTEEEAYEMSTTLTKLAGDVASFYNLSQDEAYDKLKSVFSGETEALRELGVVMTQDALLSYALENSLIDLSKSAEQMEEDALDLEKAQLDVEKAEKAQIETLKEYNADSLEAKEATLKLKLATKSLKDAQDEMNKSMKPSLDNLSEAEKVSLRYKFVLDRLSAAQGDFQRTQKSWANQTRVLALEWETFQVTMGQGFMDVLAPAVEFINDSVMPALQNMAEAFVEAVEPTPAQNLIDTLESLGDAVTDIDEKTAELSRELSVNAAMTEDCIQKLEALEEAGLETAEAQQQYEMTVRRINELQPEWNLAIDEHTGLVNMDTEAMRANIEEQKNYAMQQAQLEAVKGYYDAYYESLKAVHEAEYDLYVLQNKAVVIYQDLADIMGMSIDQVRQYTPVIGEFGYALKDQAGNTLNLSATEKALVEELAANLTHQIGLNAAMKEGAAVSEELLKKADGYAKFLETKSDNIGEVTAKQKDLNSEIDNTATTISESQTAIEENADAFEEASNEEIQSISEVSEHYEKSFDEMSEETSKSLEDISQEFDKTFDDINKSVKMDIDSIQREINNLTGKKVDVIVNTTHVTKYETIGTPSSGTSSFGGYPKTYNAAPSLAASYEPAAMNALPVAEPYLAEGTVVPPMATFPAVAAFSSMRRADNEELIREIVRAENSGLSDGLDDVNENLNTLIGIVSQMNLDGNMIFNSYNDRERKMAIVRGVRR